MPNHITNVLVISSDDEQMLNRICDAVSSRTDEEYLIGFDFNKVIPEPEEITKTPSGSYNAVAKNIADYKSYIANKDESDTYIQHDRNNPLAKPVRKQAEVTAMNMGDLVIENPDIDLNTLLSDEENKYLKDMYDRYVEVFGNTAYKNCKDFRQVYENYIRYNEENFKKNILENTNQFAEIYKQYNSLEDMGNKLNDLKEKYNFDNWYDWRNANWGTKWNACESDYDKESESLHFDTAWSIPYPILTKIAHDNPNTNFDGYSEEETGWFDEYNAHNGKINITCRGELEYDDNDQITENREESNEVLEYPSYLEQSIRDWKKFTEIKLNTII